MVKEQGVDIPSTLLRSSEKAQRTHAQTLKNIHHTLMRKRRAAPSFLIPLGGRAGCSPALGALYGPGERAGRTAYSSLKHSFEKVDDRWQAKDHPRPSDSQAAQSGAQAQPGRRDSAGGVDVFGQSRAQLLEQAKRLNIRGRSTMNKEVLAQAIAEKQG